MLRVDETWQRLREWTGGQAPAERLAGQILLASGYTRVDPSHPLGGPDGGKDALAERDGERWIMAAYFPRGQQSLGEIKAKLVADGAGVAANAASGMAFVTNQELTLGERQQLHDAVASPLDLFHLERITALLDQPGMEGVREQFLSIPARSTSGMRLAASRRLERLSEVALQDADRIGRDRDRRRQHERASVRLFQQLYVHRPQEELVFAALDDRFRSVLVIGEPGTGKTSLLWRLHGRLRELGAEAYFIRATLGGLADHVGDEVAQLRGARLDLQQRVDADTGISPTLIKVCAVTGSSRIFARLVTRRLLQPRTVAVPSRV